MVVLSVAVRGVAWFWNDSLGGPGGGRLCTLNPMRVHGRRPLAPLRGFVVRRDVVLRTLCVPVGLVSRP